MKVIPIIGHNAEIAQWVANHPPFNAEWGFGNCTAIGWMANDKLIGGTVYNHYDKGSGVIELSSASDDPRWLTRDTINTMFSYPFDQLKCQMVVIRVSEFNDRMRGIAQRFGFDEYVIPRLRGRDEDECVYTLTAEQWMESPFRKPNHVF